MSKDFILLLSLLLISIYLLINGYNAVFKTKKYLLKITNKARYKVNSKMYKHINSSSNFLSVKIIGICIIIFGIVFLIVLFLKMIK